MGHFTLALSLKLISQLPRDLSETLMKISTTIRSYNEAKAKGERKGCANIL